jgi:hypothetical protein
MPVTCQTEPDRGARERPSALSWQMPLESGSTAHLRAPFMPGQAITHPPTMGSVRVDRLDHLVLTVADIDARVASPVITCKG